MKLEEFKNWLKEVYPESTTTVNNRISNCKTIESHYGDLSKCYAKDKCKSIINELNYTVNDERINAPQKHRVPIKGVIRTGSATYKQALNLYIQFCDINENNESLESDSIIEERSIQDSSGAELLKQLLIELDSFKYIKKLHKDVFALQLDICDFLNLNYNEYTWETEYKPSSEYRDCVDIIGFSKTHNFKIVIELDAHRADQVAKKIVSRMALFIDENVIYLSLCYPGTKKMPKNECVKYFDYCSVIANNLSNNSKSETLFSGKFMG